ncbi:MAG: hypothetical protein LBK66_02885 [Spirochaetaceae bacterium]|jgi:hypothetical protein|nr:hypothetical protein [Spirochaetaceae bacterium]
MTISKHIVLLKAGIVISFLSLAAFAVSVRYIFPFYPSLMNYGQAPRDILTFIAGLLPAPVPYAAFISTGISVLFAFAAQVLLFYYFEKTQLIEIRFLGIFLFSFTFEVLRILFPLKEALQLSGYVPVITARLLIFGRLYGLFALFAAGLYACGFKLQREEKLFFPIAIIALMFAFRLPLDMFHYYTNIFPVIGFLRMFRIMDASIILLSVYCFISGAYTRSNSEYYFIALGLLAVTLGRSLLFAADTWLLLFPGLVLLVFGAWFTGKQLRRMYLWA